MWSLRVFVLILAIPLWAQTTTPPPLSIQDAAQAALQQASAYQQAIIDEKIAAFDVTQSHASLLPKLRSSTTATLNKPLHPGNGTDPSFIAQNSAKEYQELVGFEGSLGFGLRAAIARSRALLEAAHAGTEIARRALVRGVREAYYGLALANAKRRSAEEILSAAEEFERVTTLQNSGGEVPEVDVIRARLQTAQRRDDFEQARMQETIAAAALRVLVGTGIPAPLTVAELTPTPTADDVERFSPAMVARRPEIVQAEAQKRAARAGVSVARGDRLPSVTYAIQEGFDSPTLHAADIRMHSGYLATFNLSVPIFDWGIGRAKQRQAELRVKSAENLAVITRRDLERQFLTAREQALTAVRRVDNARAAVEDAKHNVDISVARYRAGEAPILEVTDALTTLAQQRTNYMQALFDFEIARGQLREAAGE